MRDTPGEMLAFVRAVEAGGFSAAARALDLTPSAMSKIISRLEERLGVRLLHRTTRSLSLTPEGEQYFARAQRIVADIEATEQELTRTRQAPRGRLRVHTGAAFGLHQLPPVLPMFMARYPEIELTLTVADRVPDLVDEGIDIAIRLGRLPDSTLVARKICDVERVICASPEYLKKHGVPRTADDLTRHNCLRLSELPELSYWPFESPGGGVKMVEVHGSFSANNAESLLQMAAAGVGLVRLTDLTVGALLTAGALVKVPVAHHRVEPVPLLAVMPSGRHRLPKVTAMVEFLIEKFADAPWRMAPLKPRARGSSAAPSSASASATAPAPARRRGTSARP